MRNGLEKLKKIRDKVGTMSSVLRAAEKDLSDIGGEKEGINPPGFSRAQVLNSTVQIQSYIRVSAGLVQDYKP